MSAAESSTSMDAITVRVKTIEDTSYSLDVPKDLTVAAFKQRLKSVSEVSEDRQRLIYRGQVLKDTDTLVDCKVEDQHVVHLVVRPIGVASPTPSSTSSQTPGSASSDRQETERRNLNLGASPALNANNLFGSLFGALPDTNVPSGSGPSLNTRHAVGGSGAGDAGAVGRLAMMNALLGNTNGGGGGNLGPSVFSSGAMPASPAREGPAVVDPTSLEHVRQGLLTLQTLLTAHPSITGGGGHHSRQTPSVVHPSQGALPLETRPSSAESMAAAAESAKSSPLSSAAAEPGDLQAEESDYDEPPSLVSLDDNDFMNHTKSNQQSADRGEQSVSGGGGNMKNASEGDSDDDDALLGDLEGPHLPDAARSPDSSNRADGGGGGFGAMRMHRSSVSGIANTAAVAPTSPTPSAPHYYVGQWVDCCDTVSQWLEATVMAVEHRLPATEPAVIRQRRRAETLRAARRATRALRRARNMRARALGALSEATNRLATAEAARDEAARSGGDGEAGGDDEEQDKDAPPASAAADDDEASTTNDDEEGTPMANMQSATRDGTGSSVLDAVRRWSDSEEDSSEEEEEEVPLVAPVASVLVHYNGWPERWDEWVPCSSPRLAPFRTRTHHPRSAPYLSPSPSARVAAALPTGDDDARLVVPEVARMFNESIGPALAAFATRCEAHLHAQARSEAAAEARFLAAGAAVDASNAAAAESISMSAEDGGQTGVIAQYEDASFSNTEGGEAIPATSHSTMEATLSSEGANIGQTSAAAGAEVAPTTPQPPASTRASEMSGANTAGESTVGRPPIAPNMPWISSVALEGGRRRDQPVIMPAVATDLRSAAEAALSAEEVATEERRKLRAISAVLAPLLDRFGRLLADLAPHLETLAQLEDTPSTIAAAEAAARATVSASSGASGGGGSGGDADLLSQLSEPLLSSVHASSSAPALRSSARASSSTSSTTGATADTASATTASYGGIRRLDSEEPLSSLARRLTANIPPGRQTPSVQESGRSYRQLISTPPASGAGNIDIHIHAIVAPVRRDPRNTTTEATPPPVALSSEDDPSLPDLIPPMPSSPQEEANTDATVGAAAADTSNGQQNDASSSSSSSERLRLAEERAAAAEARLEALTAQFNELTARNARTEEDLLSSSFAQAASGQENAVMVQGQRSEEEIATGPGDGGGADSAMARSQDTHVQTGEQVQIEMERFGTPPRSPAEPSNDGGDDDISPSAPPRSPSSFGSLVGMIRRIGSRTRRQTGNERRSSLGSGVSSSPRATSRRGSM